MAKQQDLDALIELRDFIENQKDNIESLNLRATTEECETSQDIPVEKFLENLNKRIAELQATVEKPEQKEGVSNQNNHNPDCSLIGDLVGMLIAIGLMLILPGEFFGWALPFLLLPTVRVVVKVFGNENTFRDYPGSDYLVACILAVGLILLFYILNLLI